MDESYFYKRIEIEDEELPEPVEHTEKVSKFTLGDFTEILAYQDIQVTEVFGDYQLGSFRLHESPRMIFVGEKQAARH
jgi:hypothetical protein